MDIYHFISSKDIRAHLQSLRYDFTLPEAAFLIWQCATAALSEKHAAWRELIQTMPDCRMEPRRNMCEIQSMHGFLQEYIELEEKLLRDFHLESDAVYFFNLSERDNSFPNGFSETEKFNRAFLNLSSCLAAIKGGIDGIDPRNILRIEIKKQRLSVPENTLTICMNSKLEVMDTLTLEPDCLYEKNGVTIIRIRQIEKVLLQIMCKVQNNGIKKQSDKWRERRKTTCTPYLHNSRKSKACQGRLSRQPFILPFTWL